MPFRQCKTFKIENIQRDRLIVKNKAVSNQLHPSTNEPSPSRRRDPAVLCRLSGCLAGGGEAVGAKHVARLAVFTWRGFSEGRHALDPLRVCR